MASHQRGYPALLDIVRDMPVGALVFARNAIAGDLWLPDGNRAVLEHARIVGRPIRSLYPSRPIAPISDLAYDRQARLFGDRGQDILVRQKVGVIGAGGAGSLIVEYLARLGVGHILVADPDRIELSNLPRVVGSTRLDARSWLTSPNRPLFMQRLGMRFSTRKTRVARRVARKSNPKIRMETINGDFSVDAIARRFIDCDYIFLAADSMRARLVFNAIVHQYLIPGSQVGAKVTVNDKTGNVEDVFSVFRPVTPESGCLWCNGLIHPSRLQEEAISEEERRQQRYVDDDTVVAPSVITLNATAAAHAADDFLFCVTALLDPQSTNDYRRFDPRLAEVIYEQPRKDPNCSECGRGTKARLARGDAVRLPTR